MRVVYTLTYAVDCKHACSCSLQRISAVKTHKNNPTLLKNCTVTMTSSAPCWDLPPSYRPSSLTEHTPPQATDLGKSLSKTMPRVVPTSLPVCTLCNLGIAWHSSSYLDSAWKALILTVALYLEIRPTSRAQSLTMRACSVGAIMRCAWHGRSEKGRPGVRFLNEWVPRGAKSCHGCHAITLRCQGSLTTRPNHI